MQEQIFDPRGREDWSVAELMDALNLEMSTVEHEIQELKQAELFGPLPPELQGELILLNHSLEDMNKRLAKVREILERHRGERH